jgi:iron complex outermembrane receptor protein
MKNVLFLLLITTSAIGGQTLSGKVTHLTTSEPLPGAVIYFPDLKSGTVSRADGTFEISNLPAIRTLLQVKLIGYKTLIETIDLSKTSVIELVLEEAVLEANEVVVTGVSKATEIKRNPVPMAFMDKKQIEQNTATNAIDVIVKVPGVSAVATGPNISKPMIRGLGYNRILTLVDGVRQEGQQWGDEHGVEMDQFLIDRVEVVKGPASLIYGSDALAGVINLLPMNPVPQGMIRASVQGNYQSNNGLRAVSAACDASQNGFLWGFRATHKSAMDYTNPVDGRVFNTGFLEKDLSFNLGLNRRWGFTHLNFSIYDNLQEIPDGSRDSVTRKFTRQVTEADSLRPIVSNKELNAYDINNIHQHISHYRIFSSTNVILRQGRMGLKMSYQQNNRREYAHPQLPGLAGLALDLNTVTYDIKYYLPELKAWDITIGSNGMYQQNRLAAGTDYIIPEYSMLDGGVFASARKNYRKWDIAFGARYDSRRFVNESLYLAADSVNGFQVITGDTIHSTRRFENYRHIFTGFSGSAGFTYNISKRMLVKGNVARGYRSPNISEISAGGVHPGTGFEQLGDKRLKPEFSLQEDAGFFYSSEHVSGSLEIFNNRIDNYIFNQKLAALGGGDSIYTESGNRYTVFKFRQTKALLYGGEINVDVHPHPFDWLHFENSVSVVLAQNLGGNGAVIDEGNKYLPFIPPVHTNSELRAEIGKRKGPFSDIFVKIGYQYFAAQNRIYSAEGTETRTPGYGLVDAGLGAQVNNKKNKALCTIGVFATNLADAAYQSNMSRLKYFEPYPGNQTGHSGIYNMGRNISFKLTIPFSGSFKNQVH